MATNNVINANIVTPLIVTDGGTGVNTLTLHGLLLGNAAGAIVSLAEATDGQLPIGSTGTNPVLNTLTPGAGVSITNGPGTITIDSIITQGIITLDGDTGSATGTTVTLAGGNNIATAASASTVTFNVSGTTNHAVQVGNSLGSLTSLGVGTTGQVLIGSTGSDPAFNALGVNSALTDHSLIISHGNSAFTALGAATNGQLPIGSGGSDPVLATLTPGAGISVTNGAGSITIDSLISQGIVTLNGNSGSATGTTVTLSGANNITTTASGSTVSFNVTGTSVHAVQIGNASGSLTSIGVGTTGQVLIGSTTADPSFGALGVNSGLTAHSLLLGQGTSAITALGAATNGQLPIGSTGTNPVLTTLSSSGSTITITNGAGSINLDTAGSIPASFHTDSGNATPSAGVLTIAGGSNMNTSGSGSTVTINLNNSPSVSGSLTAGTGITATTGSIQASAGSVAASAAVTAGTTMTAGTGITATTGNITATAGNMVITAGNLTLPATNTAGTQGIIKIGSTNFLSGIGNNIFVGGSGNTTTSSINNTGIGIGSLAAITSGSTNVGIGLNALAACTTGSGNLALGQQALQSGTNPVNNIAMGQSALFVSNGSGNTAIGVAAMQQSTSGGNNLAMGQFAGFNYTGAESNNILFGSFGTLGDSGVTRIGTAGLQTATFVSGIAGVTVASSATVLINTLTGQLGTVVSSRRYKDTIEPMEEVSSPIMQLNPVTFTYKSDATKRRQYGLIAEEVDEHMPELVVRNEQGEPDSVAYHDLPVLLLNEVKKLLARVEELEHALANKE